MAKRLINYKSFIQKFSKTVFSFQETCPAPNSNQDIKICEQVTVTCPASRICMDLKVFN